MNDTVELRHQLDGAWRSLVQRLVGSGHPPAVVVETMFEVAALEFGELHGRTAAANYMQLLASQVLAEQKNQVRDLIAG